jgi:hypothetical protein
MRRVDVLLTNPLHGLVYALHNGVPTIAVDPVAGAAKLAAQARAPELAHVLSRRSGNILRTR